MHGKSTEDQIFSLRGILEKIKKYSFKTHHLFVDFRFACDNIDQDELYKALRELNGPPKLVRLVRKGMTGIEYFVEVKRRGVSQQLEE